MSGKHEILLAKIITLIIIVLTLLEIRAEAFTHGRGRIIHAFMTHNKKLTREQAESFTEIIYRAGAKYHVSASLIAAIIICESNVNPRAVSRKNSVGLMQIHYPSHKMSVKNREDLFDPELNIFLGTGIYASFRAKSWSIEQALKRYSGNSRNYAKKVVRVLRTIAR